MKNKIIIFTGPSGAGKTEMCNFLKEVHKFKGVKTFTTRKPRQEESSSSYNFITESEFQDKIKNNEFIEYVHNHGNYYGSNIDTNSDANIVVALDLRGALSYKQKLANAYIILLKVSPENALNRISDRSIIPDEEIQKRIQEMKTYFSSNFEYDYTINADEDLEAVKLRVSEILRNLHNKT